jgi:hypothetical protein
MSTYKVDNIDGLTAIQDQTDSTKKVRFDLSNISTDTVRIFTIPNNNLTIVGEDTSQTLTSKTINANNNTLSNIGNTHIKAGAAIDASKIGDGSVSSTQFEYLNSLSSQTVGVSDSQVVTNKTFTDNSTYLQDNLDNTKKAQFQLSGISTGQTRILTIPDANATLVGTDNVQTFTNKTINAGSNTISGLAKSDVGLSNVENVKVNLSASTAPTSTDDSSSGYAVGSVWIDTTNDKAYVCVDATISSAVWTEITSQGEVGMNWQGAWTAQNYVVDDAVEYNGSAYICKLNTVSNEVPSNTTYWDLMASKGDSIAVDNIYITSTTETSTTSGSYIVVNGMTSTPVSGTYMVSFSASGQHSSGSADATYAIYNGGSIVADSERNFGWNGGSHTNGFVVSMHSQVIITVNGSQAVEVKYKDGGTGTFTIYNRSLILLKVG